jgi:hypothetical protein
VLTISRLARSGRGYAVEDDRGHRGTWERRRFDVDMTGDIDGRTYALGHKKRTQFSLTEAGEVVVRADYAGRRRWTISVGETAYELRQPSMWRQDMELLAGGAKVGSVRKVRAGVLRNHTLCDLPPDLPTGVQAFIGFVAMALWQRAAADAGAGAV